MAYWSQEIISDKGLMLSVNGLQDLVCQTHPFSQLLHDAIHLAFDNGITCPHAYQRREGAEVDRLK